MLQDLDPKLINALEELRREFDDKLSRQRQELERLVGSTLPVAEPEPQPEPVAAAEIRPAAGLDLLEELKLAAAEIDGAESQGDVLDALIRGACRFSSRSAVFLYRDGALHGWDGTGFGAADAAIKDMPLDCPEDSPWEQILTGEGGICLSSADCSVLVDKLGADPADMGLLVPFILRRQVAAVVYADRTARDQPFNISGLQLLSFLAGLTVETLPIRERPSTTSLQLAVATAPVEEAAPALDEAVTESPEQVTESAALEVEEVEAELEEAPVEESPVEAQVAAPEPEPEEWGGASIVEPIEETPIEIPPQSEAPPEMVPAPPEPETPTAFEDLDASAPDLPPAQPVAPIVEPETTEELPVVAAGPPPSAAAADLSQPTEPAEPPGLTSTQVQPPQDVEGPGWAFTTTRIPTSAGVEALHEEARRLARLLVTEIKLYNEELVEEGRQAGDVYSRLREDIDRSRQIFDDRIDPEVRNEKDYFREALIRILAGGDPAVLGISN